MKTSKICALTIIAATLVDCSEMLYSQLTTA
jgi:hypothetical protein